MLPEAPPSLVIVVTTSCPACIWVMETLETMCQTRNRASGLSRMYTVDASTAAALWPQLAIPRVPRAVLLRNGTAKLLDDAPMVSEEHIRRLARQLMAA